MEEIMETMEQVQHETYDYDEKDYNPVEEENGQVPAGDPADQPENEKTFTQEEVNKIIQKRLDRERQKNELRNNPDEYIKLLEEREEQILERELQYEAEQMRAGLETEFCMQPKGLLEYLDYSSKEAMESSFKKFQELILNPINEAYVKAKLRGSTPRTGSTYSEDKLKNAFKPEK